MPTAGIQLLLKAAQGLLLIDCARAFGSAVKAAKGGGGKERNNAENAGKSLGGKRG